MAVYFFKLNLKMHAVKLNLSKKINKDIDPLNHVSTLQILLTLENGNSKQIWIRTNFVSLYYNVT